MEIPHPPQLIDFSIIIMCTKTTYDILQLNMDCPVAVVLGF